MAHLSRWQVVPVNRKQSLAEHSWFVAVIAKRIVVDLNMTGQPITVGVDICSINMENILWEALMHDVPEIVGGDTPGPIHALVKKEAPGLKVKISKEVKRFLPWFEESPDPLTRQIVCMADLTEACLFLLEEIQSGNVRVKPHYEVLRHKTVVYLEGLDWVFGGGECNSPVSWFEKATVNAQNKLKVIGERGWL
jgi:5'-deoxynucleotidase YfbR-like HD superfamily hydrolase